MKKLLLLITLILSLQLTAQRTPKVIFIIADGIPADLIESLPMPNLHAITKHGGYTRAHVGGEKGGYSETPTISAVGYNSLLTGTWVNKHNVWDNDIAAPNYHYYNIFRLLKERHPEKTTAVFSTWLDNRTKLVGSDSADAGKIMPEYYYDGMELDTVRFPHDTAGYFYHVIDEAVTDSAAANIRRHAPDLSWVYLEYTDELGHRHGNSKELTDAVKMLDKQLGRIWAAIQYRQQHFNEDWQIWITTDHGREENGYGHGGQGDRERTTWIATNAKRLNSYFKTGNPGIVDIMPTMAKHLRLTIPRTVEVELDGIPLTGRLSAIHPVITVQDSILTIHWTPLLNEGIARIWVSTTNEFGKGGKDHYFQITSVAVSKGEASFKLKDMPSDFYKLVVEMPENVLTKWYLFAK